MHLILQLLREINLSLNLLARKTEKKGKWPTSLCSEICSGSNWLGRSTLTRRSTRRATKSSTSTLDTMPRLQTTPNLWEFVEKRLILKGNIRISKMIQEDAALKKKTSSTQEKVQRLIARKKYSANQGSALNSVWQLRWIKGGQRRRRFYSRWVGADPWEEKSRGASRRAEENLGVGSNGQKILGGFEACKTFAEGDQGARLQAPDQHPADGDTDFGVWEGRACLERDRQRKNSCLPNPCDPKILQAQVRYEFRKLHKVSTLFFQFFSPIHHQINLQGPW